MNTLLGADAQGQEIHEGDRVQHPHAGPGVAVRVGSRGAISVRVDEPQGPGSGICHAWPADLVRLAEGA